MGFGGEGRAIIDNIPNRAISATDMSPSRDNRTPIYLRTPCSDERLSTAIYVHTERSACAVE
jgi:hypothetical protein